MSPEAIAALPALELKALDYEIAAEVVNALGILGWGVDIRSIPDGTVLCRAINAKRQEMTPMHTGTRRSRVLMKVLNDVARHERRRSPKAAPSGVEVPR